MNMNVKRLSILLDNSLRKTLPLDKNVLLGVSGMYQTNQILMFIQARVLGMTLFQHMPIINLDFTSKEEVMLINEFFNDANREINLALENTYRVSFVISVLENQKSEEADFLQLKTMFFKKGARQYFYRFSLKVDENGFVFSFKV
jgi:hypothetical protein